MNWTERRKLEARRRLAFRIAAVCAVLFAATSTTGFLLPARLVTTGRIVLGTPPEAIWRLLTDLDGMPLWRSDLESLERLPDQNGRPAWREIGSGGSRVMELAEAEPPHRLVLQRTVEGKPALPTRSFDLVSTPQGTVLTFKEDREVLNPLGRVLARVRTPRGGVLRFLRDLEQRLSGPRRQVATAGT